MHWPSDSLLVGMSSVSRIHAVTMRMARCCIDILLSLIQRQCDEGYLRSAYLTRSAICDSPSRLPSIAVLCLHGDLEAATPARVHGAIVTTVGPYSKQAKSTRAPDDRIVVLHAH